MTNEEKDRIEKAARDKAFQEANLENRLKAVEEAVDSFQGALKWFFRAIWGGIAYLLTQVASGFSSGWWPK